ncbi:KUP system potassium uptake protein [Microdochium nivale]|nr:KUP system potassium uptake protein [Microdochium nivale]
MDHHRTTSSRASISSSGSAAPSEDGAEDIELPDLAYDNDADDVGDSQPAAAVAASAPAPVASAAGLTYDEEKARKIAIYDLNKAHKQDFRGRLLLWVAFQSTGVIYGEIGTSPLYVFSSTFSRQPSWLDLTGALSIIIWSLTLIVTVKYAFIVLRADDDGQGGTFALYSLLSRYTQIVESDPRLSGLVQMRRCPTGELRPGARSVRRIVEKSSVIKFVLKVVGVVGVSLVIAETVLMPAQSVLGAVQGIRVADPDLGTPAVVGITCALLIVLFLLQPFGTAKLGTTFAPIVTVWLFFNLGTGIYNLAAYDHTVLRAFNPAYAFDYLTRNGYDGWKSLGGLLLAFTGVEALFADLGAFSMTAVQISWLFLAYPCLLFTYAGQAAFIAVDESATAFTNPFFYTVPPGTFYFSLVIAMLAAIVASQAMITSTFQLLSQVIKMSYFPHIKVVHTSKRFHEQVYMPLANWLLMIGTVIVTAVFNNTTSLGQAYGVCVILVTFITTCLVALVAVLVWHVPIFLVAPVFLVFAALDGAFMTAVLTKVPDGAWVSLVLAFGISSIFILWRFGKEAQWSAESLDKLTALDLFDTSTTTRDGHSNDHDDASITATGNNAAGASSVSASIRHRGQPGHDPNGPSHFQHQQQQPRLAPAFGGHPVSTVPGLGIFFDKIGDPALLPVSFVHFVRKFAARPTVLVFFHMRPLPVPFVDLEERFVVTAARAKMPTAAQLAARSRMVHVGDDAERRARLASIPASAVAAAAAAAVDDTRDSGVGGLGRITPPPLPRPTTAQDDIDPATNPVHYVDHISSSDTGNNILLPNTYNIVLRHGYAEKPTPAGLAEELVAQVELAVARTAVDEGGAVAALEALRSACRSQTVYVLGKETLRVRKAGSSSTSADTPISGKNRMSSVTSDLATTECRRGSEQRTAPRWSPWGLGRRVLLGAFLWIRENSRTKLAEVNINVDSVVEVGFLKEIS